MNFKRKQPRLIYFERTPRFKASLLNSKLNALPANQTTALVTFTYSHKDKEITQVFKMVRRFVRASSFWEFVCPTTGKQCKQLYFVNGKYGHRDAFKGIATYRDRTLGHKQRGYLSQGKPHNKRRC